MSDDELTYEEIVDVWEREKESKKPSYLPDNFYKRLRKYIQGLEKEVEEIEVPPKNKRAKRIQKQYQRVQKVAELFFKERQKKIVLSAYHKSLGKKVSSENLTDPELDLLEDISGSLKDLKNQIFLGEYKRKAKEDTEIAKKEKEGKEEVEKKTIEKTKNESEIDQGSELGEETIQSQKEEKDEDLFTPRAKSLKENSPEEVLVHITEDVPSFVDIDATYDLKKEDVLTLREDIAEILIKREKARKIKL